MRTIELKIDDPSGETRTLVLPLKERYVLGRAPECDIPLRDPTLPMECAEIAPIALEDRVQGFWLRMTASDRSAKVGALDVKESTLPAEASLRVGETRIQIRADATAPALPAFPRNARPWLTRSESGARMLWMARKAAATPLSMYLSGETGTGKEVIASLLHAWSDRAGGPFVPVNCGALPASLAESELFGHVKGAYTGATSHRTGALLQAHGGTLFLDEIADLTLDLQVKLLRFLENGEVRPVGSDQIRHANVRVLCATHQKIDALVEAGRFRRDLYYRLASVTIEIPALRERPEDVELLAVGYARDMGKTLDHDALLRLRAYPWPGNVRELRHAVERACGLSGPFVETLDAAQFEFLKTASEKELDLLQAEARSQAGDAPIVTLKEMERLLILKALRLTRGNRGDAAKLLGIARSTLFEMLKRHRIQGPRAELMAARAELKGQLARRPSLDGASPPPAGATPGLAEDEARKKDLDDLPFYTA